MNDDSDWLEKILKQIEERDEMNWIKTTEQLPKDIGICVIAFWNPMQNDFNYDIAVCADGVFFGQSKIRSTTDVAYWMPIEKPQKEYNYGVWQGMQRNGGIQSDA